MSNDKTDWIYGDMISESEIPNNNPTDEIAGGGSYDPTVPYDDDHQTRILEDDKTALYNPADFLGESTEIDYSADPVVGWLVIVKGPGLGYSIPLGSGSNSIGRSDEERACINFGDKMISQKDHLRVIYDEEERQFIVAPGSGKNVSRLEGKIIASPQVLNNFEFIALSKNTYVRFAAFCNQDFDWGDLRDE